jgi:hypothetical protein
VVDTSLLFKPYLGLGKPWTNHHDPRGLTGGRQVPIVPNILPAVEKKLLRVRHYQGKEEVEAEANSRSQS